MRDPRSTGRSLRGRPGRANLTRHQDRREMAKPAREVGDVRPPPHVVLIGESAGDREERLGGDGHHPDDLANAVKLEALARHRSRHGPDWTSRDARQARMRQPPFARVVFQRSYASAFAFSASNSCCVIAPASSSSLAWSSLRSRATNATPATYASPTPADARQHNSAAGSRARGGEPCLRSSELLNQSPGTTTPADDSAALTRARYSDSRLSR